MSSRIRSKPRQPWYRYTNGAKGDRTICWSERKHNRAKVFSMASSPVSKEYVGPTLAEELDKTHQTINEPVFTPVVTKTPSPSSFADIGSDGAVGQSPDESKIPYPGFYEMGKRDDSWGDEMMKVAPIVKKDGDAGSTAMKLGDADPLFKKPGDTGSTAMKLGDADPLFKKPGDAGSTAMKPGKVAPLFKKPGDADTLVKKPGDAGSETAMTAGEAVASVKKAGEAGANAMINTAKEKATNLYNTGTANAKAVLNNVRDNVAKSLNKLVQTISTKSSPKSIQGGGRRKTKRRRYKGRKTKRFRRNYKRTRRAKRTKRTKRTKRAKRR